MKTMVMRFVLIVLSLFSVGTVGGFSNPLKIDVSFDQSIYLIKGDGRAWLKVGLSGAELVSDKKRPPLNLSIVLDRSGSMEGEKLKKAKEAALYAVSLLKKDDYLSLVVYDSEVEVMVPSQKVGDREVFESAIRRIEALESTALFAGVSAGAKELKAHLDPNRVNRVILLSDGLANVGPDSPQALGDLGASLRKQGISVTTIGLGDGYNEDLMTRLAMSSDGNHAYVAEPRDLAKIFDAELADARAIAATDIKIQIDLGKLIKIKRIVNREGNIKGNTVELSMNQVISGQEKYALIEVELPKGSDGQKIEAAKATVSFRNMDNKKTETQSFQANLSFSKDEKLAKSSARKDIKEKVVVQMAAEVSEEAIRLQDAGKIQQAKKLLQQNAQDLKKASDDLNSDYLDKLAGQSAKNAEDLEAPDADLNTIRKAQSAEIYNSKTQQSY